ncbi:hypothetical protein ACJW30_07G113400 [Castanea mollissima]
MKKKQRNSNSIHRCCLFPLLTNKNKNKKFQHHTNKNPHPPMSRNRATTTSFGKTESLRSISTNTFCATYKKEQNWYLTSAGVCQRYSEMKFKSEIPKFFQQFKKKKGNKTMTQKLGICLILTLNKKKIDPLRNPQR